LEHDSNQAMAPMIKNLEIWGLRLAGMLMVLTIIAALILRLYKIDSIPYGYHVDEMCSSVTIQCLATEGVDAHSHPYPIFGQTNYGTPKPATYMYPGVLWGKLFGFAVPSLRSFSVWANFLGVLGLFFLGRLLLGTTFGLWAAFLGAISPWVWVMSRVAFESLFAPTFFIWGLYFFFRRQTYTHWVIAAFLFAVSMYFYPPMRLQVPLMLMTLWLYSLKKYKTSYSLWAVFIICLILPLIPLVLKTLSGEIQQRFNDIAIWSPGYLKAIGKTNSLKDLLGIFLTNYKLHLTPNFLLFKGDPSLIHSTGHFGILSWLDMAALVMCVGWALLFWTKPLKRHNPWFEHMGFLLFLIVNIFLGIVPSAVTNSEIPNTLRVVGSWPFMCLLSAYFLYRLQRLCWPLGLVAITLGLLFLTSFTKVYFGVYQQESKGMFDYWSKDQADSAKTEEDWTKFMVWHYDRDYHFRYFLMQERADTCSSSLLKWQKQRKILDTLHYYPH